MNQGKKILLFSDAWEPQINGVTTILHYLMRELDHNHHIPLLVHPGLFPYKFSIPKYRNLPIVIAPSYQYIRGIITGFAPHHIHIFTEGPIGVKARKVCSKEGYRYTTSFHTRWEDYLKMYFKVPRIFTQKFIRWFHQHADKILVPSQSIAELLKKQKLTQTIIWPGGINLDVFVPSSENIFNSLPRPIFSYIGRVAKEKNIEAFLNLDLPGSKVVVGDGPHLKALQMAYPKIHFAGGKQHQDLPKYYSSSDVFVFPSKTDTFGLTIIESLACGTPVAAYPVPGPLDILSASNVGVIHHDLRQAALAALNLSRDSCTKFAAQFSFEAITNLFLKSLAEI